jgi:hypothetical protein
VSLLAAGGVAAPAAGGERPAGDMAGIARDIAERKQRELHDQLRRFSSLIVAFSGGADSAYLAWAAT